MRTAGDDTADNSDREGSCMAVKRIVANIATLQISSALAF
jgi:hypothetical protein